MNPRKAFQVFIRYQLQSAKEENVISLSDSQIEKFASDIEDDSFFYDKLSEFLAEFIEDYGDNYDLFN